MRFPTATGGAFGQPSNRYSLGSCEAPPASSMLSEYRSSFGPNLCAERAARQNSRAHSPSLGATATTPLQSSASRRSAGETSSDESDDGMSAYRASSYVPKVVPIGFTPPRRASRCAARRRQTSLLAKDAADDGEKSSPPPPPRRWSSARQPDGDVSPPTRRRSETGAGAGEAAENSRLSELEQRIQANRRRREELLASGKA